MSFTFYNQLLFFVLGDFKMCLFILSYEKHKNGSKKGCFCCCLNVVRSCLNLNLERCLKLFVSDKSEGVASSD